jgi:sigma-B regulation protein RsbQ
VTVPMEVGRYLHQHLPQATLEVMKATGHYPHVSHPQETIELIRRYLAQPA